MSKTAITVNGSEGKNIFPPIIIGTSSAATGDEVILFFTPAGAPVMKKGAMEKINANAKNLPDLIEMYEGLVELGARFFVCELALDVHGLKKEDFRDEVEIVGATTFVGEADGAQLTLSF